MAGAVSRPEHSARGRLQARLAGGSQLALATVPAAARAAAGARDDRADSAAQDSHAEALHVVSAVASSAGVEHAHVAVAERQYAHLPALLPGLGDPAVHRAQYARGEPVAD